jgi:hypothetical protein
MRMNEWLHVIIDEFWESGCDEKEWRERAKRETYVLTLKN